MNDSSEAPLPAAIEQSDSVESTPPSTPRAPGAAAAMAQRQTPEASVPMLNRELGMLAFNERVFALAEDASQPLLERLRFLTIVSSNLDEFYEVRVAELKEIIFANKADASAARGSVSAIANRVRRLVDRQYGLLNEVLLPGLAREGIEFHLSTQWNTAQQAWAQAVFEAEIEPLLTPIALDPAHPFPRILNKSLNFVVELEGEDDFGRAADIAIVQAPRSLPRILSVPVAVSGARHGMMLLTSVVQGFVGRLFPGMTIRSIHQFRLTRNSELFVDDEEITDLREALQGELPQRHFGDCVRLEVSAGCPESVVARLLNEFELTESDCFRVAGPVNLNRLSQVLDLVDRDDLKFPVFQPTIPAVIRDRDLFEVIRERDVLLHHPYESFAPVIDFIGRAARDPQVMAIRQTIYRTGADSALMASLLDAARGGKEVTVVVELMARFDEETNINWAARLEHAGVHVVYGVVGHKTHAKMTMIIRREEGRLRRYVHLGTGNYHPRTARLYEDFGLFTANTAICDDVHEVFRRLTGVGKAAPLKALLQAPFTLHAYVMEAIGREISEARAGRKAYIAAKINALLDAKVIGALYEASQAGVQIDLIVRGVCALRPGIPGLSENIRVRSIVGRFLEHSRVYYFWNAGKQDIWLSSADWMERNFFRRVETAFPILDRHLKRRVLIEALNEHLADNTSAWVMDADGDYHRRQRRGASARVSQERLLERLTVGTRPSS